MPGHFRLFLKTTEPTAPLIALLRRHIGKPTSDLRQAITNRQPFLDDRPHHNQYDQFIERVTELLDELEAGGVSYQVEIDGSLKTPQYLRNVFKQRHEIGEQTKRMTDLESGEPCIETLEWLKREHPSDVFWQTL